MTFIIKDTYTNEVVQITSSKNQALNWCGKQAQELNYGMFRTWEDPEKGTFCDVGPKTYVIKMISKLNNPN